tara:strand:+ start:369 stop:800 length:432 start_codon:yes stop_codon:yes gene_type:complete
MAKAYAHLLERCLQHAAAVFGNAPGEIRIDTEVYSALGRDGELDASGNVKYVKKKGVDARYVEEKGVNTTLNDRASRVIVFRRGPVWRSLSKAEPPQAYILPNPEDPAAVAAWDAEMDSRMEEVDQDARAPRRRGLAGIFAGL